MKRLILLAAVGLALAGCSKNDTSTSAAANQNGMAASTDSRVVPNAKGITTSERTTEPAGPATGVGSSAAASSGIGTASASASTALESKSAERKNTPQTGTGAQHPLVNSNGVGNARRSEAGQQSGSGPTR